MENMIISSFNNPSIDYKIGNILITYKIKFC